MSAATETPKGTRESSRRMRFALSHPTGFNFRLSLHPILRNRIYAKLSSLSSKAAWPSGTALDFESRDRGFDPHGGHSLLLFVTLHLCFDEGGW